VKVGCLPAGRGRERGGVATCFHDGGPKKKNQSAKRGRGGEGRWGGLILESSKKTMEHFAEREK